MAAAVADFRPESPLDDKITKDGRDSLSVDLVRSLDHKAPEELWVRYQNGERNVFTRRLYTLQGQAAFDELL